MPRFYAGIGARATPPEILSLMTRAAFALTKRGYVLRSGHAIGADSAFERGARSAPVGTPSKDPMRRSASCIDACSMACQPDWAKRASSDRA